MLTNESIKRVFYTSKQTGKKIYSNEIIVHLNCDVCNSTHTRTKKHYNKMKSKFIEFDKDYCNACWVPILNNRPARLENMRIGLVNAYKDNPELRVKMSKIVKGRNAGDLNPMRRLDVRKKVSATRSKLMQDSKFRDKFKQGSIDAWARGAYANMFNSGYTKWHDYLHSSGIIYKVQGKYELAFIKFLDKSNLTFTCHKGKIPYIADDGLTHHYFPDFYVDEWQSYVDPKAMHWYKKQFRKFELIKEQHPELKLQILTEEKLKQLGVKI